MRLTVLGKSPSWQDADGACSGYLIEEDETAVLLDCGNGVFSKLRQRIDYGEVDAVVISHLHADHFLDLVPYSYALTYAPRSSRCRSSAGRAPTTRKAAADLPARRRARRSGGWSARWGNDDLIENAFELEEYTGRASSTIGPLRIDVPARCRTSPRRSRCALSSANGGGRIAYGADSRPDRGVDRVRRAAPTC